MTDRFVGPLARLWPDLDAAKVATLLRPPAAALPVPPVSDRATWGPDGSADRATLVTLSRQADAERAEPWPPVPAHAWARFRRDGDRTEYEATLFARTTRLNRAVVAALADPTDARLDAVADGLVLLAEQSSWCWPAHDDAGRSGGFLPDVTRPFLDLGAGEVAAQLAWAWHVLGGPLEERYPGLGARLKLEADERVFDPFVTRRDWHWLGLDGPVHNWNPWIHGNVLVAALELIDEPVSRAEVVTLCVEGLDRYVAALPEDGAVDEGYAYWWQGAGRLLEALLVLRHATGGALDALGLPSVRHTVGFPGALALGGGWFVNYADASARPAGEQPWSVVFRAARAVGDDAAAAGALARRAPGAPVADPADGLGRLLPALADRDWATGCEPAPHSAAITPGDPETYFPSIQVWLARQHAGSGRGFTVSAKGGHNGENHNHCDVGTVIVALDGTPLIVDAGRTTYTAQTFGPDRYQIWAMQSQWHNVPVFGETGQGVGAEFRADLVGEEGPGPGRRWGAGPAQESGGAVPAQFSLDLTHAYPPGTVTRWLRTVTLDRTVGAVAVHDDWQNPAAAPELRYLLSGQVVAEGPDRVIVATLDGGQAELRWSPPLTHSLVRRPLDDPLQTAVWGDHLTQLRLAAGGVTSVTVTVVRRGEQNRT
ncbi:MAG: heparinase II/III-family protein [Propionibacteriaceae bacterium]|jgi:hypothetical protein|nr:heparinase II/III-family protein [Propionibacteriaceae bacterium]